jgi:hypothetical protein
MLQDAIEVIAKIWRSNLNNRKARFKRDMLCLNRLSTSRRTVEEGRDQTALLVRFEIRKNKVGELFSVAIVL